MSNVCNDGKLRSPNRIQLWCGPNLVIAQLEGSLDDLVEIVDWDIGKQILDCLFRIRINCHLILLFCRLF